jgi:hypothetical protein
VLAASVRLAKKFPALVGAKTRSNVQVKLGATALRQWFPTAGTA